jgi:glycosyltransferase involved in cell wall biosynthesis
MRIAQVSHLTESVPPKGYGGAERIIAYLTDELVALGHDVTLFASGDSVTAARLEPVCAEALRLPDPFERTIRLTLLLERVFGAAENFDIIHSHLDFWTFPLVRRCGTPAVSTLHGNIGLPELRHVYYEFCEIPVVSISDAQRKPCPWANWKATIHHGLPEDLYRFNPRPGRYLAFLGRLSPEKGPEEAIQIAKATGIPLRIAAKVDPADEEYFYRVIEPLLSDGPVEYVGEITDQEKNDFLGDALALMCPYRPEAFGLALIEALACGTPVITYRHGSFPEIIETGINGFLCRTIEEMIDSVPLLESLDRGRCRRSFESRFTARRMALEYLQVYDGIVTAAQSAAF